MHWHPDVNSGLQANCRMKAINVAYALVCQHLDTLHSTVGCTVGATDGFTAFDWKTGFKTGSGSAPQEGVAPREALVQRSLQVSLFEAAFGCVKRISGTATGSCPRCAGSGEFSGT